MSPSTTRNKILVILTNTDNLQRGHKDVEGLTTEQIQAYEPAIQQWLQTGQRTGFDVKAVAYLWKTFHKKENMTIDFCTPNGGRAPIDPKTLEQVKDDSVVQEFLRDREALDECKDTDKIDEMNAKDYELIVCPGSHGALIDFPECRNVQTLITEAWENGSTIATLGHGIAALLNVEDRKQGRRPGSTETDRLLKGKRVTCFANEEEKKIGYTQYVPFLIEDKVKQTGAHVETKDPFSSYVVTDANEKLITAQNMASTKDWISAISKHMRK